jgi:hypothetical protein
MDYPIRSLSTGINKYVLYIYIYIYIYMYSEHSYISTLYGYLLELSTNLTMTNIMAETCS